MVEEVGKIVADIGEEGITIVLVEQNAWLALELAQRAYVLEIEKIVLEGEAASLRNNEFVMKAYLGLT